MQSKHGKQSLSLKLVINLGCGCARWRNGAVEDDAWALEARG